MIKYNATFHEVNEVRMGSPYNVCEPEIEGSFVPELPPSTFQDRAAVSDDGFVCYLVQWSHVRGNPGFKIWRLDGDKKSFSISPRFEGLCFEISAVGEKEVNFVIEKHDEISRKMLSEQKTYTFE